MGACKSEVCEPKKYVSDYFAELESKLMNEESRNRGISEVEEDLLKDMTEPGRRLLQEHIDTRGNGETGDAVVRDDGKVLNHRREGERHFETLFGEVSIRRMGYSQRTESAVFPLDGQMELPPKLYSYALQKKVCREALRGSYDEINETLSEYTGAHVPKRQAQEIVVSAADDFDVFYKQRSGKPSDSEILVLSGDGKGIIMRTEGLREATRKCALSQKMSKRRSKGEKKNRKREAFVAAVYSINPYIRTADDVMRELNREKQSDREKRRKRPRPEEKRVWASLKKGKRTVFHEIVEEGLKRTPSDKKVVFLSDGDKTIRKLAKNVLRPSFEGACCDFVIVLDLIHAIEYLWKAAYCFHKEGSREAEEWVNRHVRMILEGRAADVAGELKQSAKQRNLRGAKLEKAEKAAAYILNNKDCMRYDEYPESGFPIAAGVIEGACRHLIKDRFEITGARWGLDGAEALLKLRAVYKSGDWDEYWKFHIAENQQRTHPDNHWKPYDTVTYPQLTVVQGGKSS